MPRPPQLGTGENKPPARGSGPGPSEAPLATRHPRALGLPGGPTVRDPGPLQLHLSPLRPERPHPTPCHPARLQGPAPLGALSQGPSYPHKKTRNATGDGPGPAGHHLQQPRGDQSVRLIFPSCIPSSLPEETFSTWGSHSGVLVGGPARLVLPRFPRARPSEPLLGPRPRSIGRLAIWATRCVESSCADGHFCVCVACAHREESSESFNGERFISWPKGPSSGGVSGTGQTVHRAFACPQGHGRHTQAHAALTQGTGGGGAFPGDTLPPEPASAARCGQRSAAGIPGQPGHQGPGPRQGQRPRVGGQAGVRTRVHGGLRGPAGSREPGRALSKGRRGRPAADRHGQCPWHSQAQAAGTDTPRDLS